MNPFSSQLEIDVFTNSELVNAVEYTVQYNIRSIIVHPELVGQAILRKRSRQSRANLIMAIDWPNGSNRGMHKFRGIPLNSLDCDGVEIVVSNISSIEAHNEIKALANVLSSMPHLYDNRIVLNAYSKDKDVISAMLAAIYSTPGFKTIRTDSALRVQQSKASQRTHQDFIEQIRTAVPGSIVKISGNINTIKTIATCKADKYAVNLQQATALIDEYELDSGKADELLSPKQKNAEIHEDISK